VGGCQRLAGVESAVHDVVAGNSGLVGQGRTGFVQPLRNQVRLTCTGKVPLMVHPKLDVSRFGDDGNKGAFVLASKRAHPRICGHNQSRESSRAKIS
jgi:hypothetical protein